MSDQLLRLSKPCSISGCPRPLRAKGYCSTHYARLRRNGCPLKDGYEPPRWQKVQKDGPAGCWLWTGRKDRHGYGRTLVGGRSTGAHRWVFEQVKGAIPLGLELDHLCRNVACVNPDHLEAVTHAENLRRSEPAQRTHCPRGHAYDEQNTRIHKGKRYCRTCYRTYYRRNKVAL